MRKDDSQKVFAFRIDNAPLTGQGERIQNIAKFISSIQLSLPDAKFVIITSGSVKTAQDAANKISADWTTLSAFTEKSDDTQAHLNLDIIALGGSYVFSGLKVFNARAMAFSQPMLDLPLSSHQVLKILAGVGKTADIMYYTKDGIIYTKRQIQKKGLAAHILKSASQDKDKKFPIKETPVYKLYDSIIKDEIYTVTLFDSLLPRNEIRRSSDTKALKFLYGDESENVFYFETGLTEFNCAKKVGEALNLDSELSKAWTKTLALETPSTEKTPEKKKSHDIRSKIKAILNHNKDYGMGM